MASRHQALVDQRLHCTPGGLQLPRLHIWAVVTNLQGENDKKKADGGRKCVLA
jgi:hypothetical protein